MPDTDKATLEVLPDKITKTEDEWREILTPDQYKVLREKGTERAFTGACLNIKEPGTFACAGCGLELFKTRAKFESGTGWPSFFAPISENRIEKRADHSLFLGTRTEVLCARCGGHLGHVFNDGPSPTGLRYCLNSVSLTFKPEDETAKSEPR